MADDTISDDVAYKQSLVARFEGCSTRTIFDRVKAGLFPRPDIPAQKRGESHKWFGRTLRQHREKLQAERAAKGGEAMISKPIPPAPHRRQRQRATA